MMARFLRGLRRALVKYELAQLRYQLAHLEQVRAADQVAQLAALERQAELSAMLRGLDFSVQVDHETEQMVN